VDVAQAREYKNREGGPASVLFHAQSVLEPFRERDDQIVENETIDLVNSCGAIGCHFAPPATQALARECARVLRPGGLALLDSGRAGTPPSQLVDIMHHLGFACLGRARSCSLDRHWQLCFRKERRSH
jgi:SAM-dependent methyltransferase